MSNQLRWRILQQFSKKNIYGITLQDVTREFPKTNPTHLAWTLSEMVKAGMLSKVAHNNYHIVPYNADPESYVPDVNQVGKCLMRNRPYYIGYASAMKIHGLALQAVKGQSQGKQRSHEARQSPEAGSSPEAGQHLKTEQSSEVYLVTGKQMKPAVRNIKGVDYHFIHSSPTRFFGFESIWINQYEEAMVSDLEKTIVDMASSPRYSRGIAGLGQAIFRMNGYIDQNRLFNYFERNMNKSGKKRFLFLTDLLGLEWSDKHDMMLGELGTGISLLDPEAANQGKIVSRFRLKLNLDPEEIKDQILNKAKG